MAVAARKFEYRWDESRSYQRRAVATKAPAIRTIYSVVIIALYAISIPSVIRENGFALQDRMNRQKAILESELNSAAALNGDLSQKLDARVSSKSVDAWAAQHGYVHAADIAAVYVNSIPPMQVARSSNGRPANVVPE
ncbi:MAG: hypothetical protein M1330_02455 [Armatimonadetes bacterium]|nr:hypothetical protein [Armatimonadota bacterium]